MAVRLEVFVASPSDMADERAVVSEVVATVAAEELIWKRASLRALLYERTVPPLLAVDQQDASGGGPQSVVNQFMDPAKCDILVCLLGDKLGTPLSGTEYQSGTEYELLTAHNSAKRPKPEILLYLRSTPSPNADPTEQRRVKEFVDSLPGLGLGAFKNWFKDKDELRKGFEGALRSAVSNLIPAKERAQKLKTAASILALICLAGAAYAGTTLPERRRAAEHEAQAVLTMAQAGDRWSEARRRLPSLGCPAVAPLTAALAATENGRPQATEAIVGALEDLAKQEPGCACPPLLSVLSVADAAGRPTCASVQREVLGAVGRLASCEQAGPVLCNYLGKVEGGDPYVTCVSDKEVDRGDLAARAKKALAARNEVTTCATK